MIVTSCPLRISLVGGSTDHPWFLDKYGKGAVISFPSNLRTYVTIHRDVLGANAINQQYVLNYSKRESVNTIDEIQNELIKHCFKYLDVKEYVNCSLTSDAFSVGSGLAASSAYLMALVKSIYSMRGKSISDFEICRIAQVIERSFNPLVGQQDFYGSLRDFKKISFYKNQDPEIRYLSTHIFHTMDYFLIPTGVVRSSTSILETIDVDKSVSLLQDVIDLENSINECNVNSFNEIIRRSWENKKMVSPNICKNDYIIDLDNKLKNDELVLSHKLCGAGNGGYFLIFTYKGGNGYLKHKYNNIQQIHIANHGFNSMNLKLNDI
jgi:D-glycero-alpha-D-manno-heptose-7-phosphate kinase